jgi:hypothetical protein
METLFSGLTLIGRRISTTLRNYRRATRTLNISLGGNLMQRMVKWTAAAILAVAAGVSADGFAAEAAVADNSPSVIIDGPSRVRPNTMCAWWAVASGGTTPYTYTWSGPSSNASTGGEYYGTSPSSGSFTVTVTVTDANNDSDVESKQVTVDSRAPMCAL